ncbi:NUDIX hydrolase [Kumtagia ephedrae]|uniref:DNA mismatch repair protein MutT n=1 Tax=Kumtagia ephedrae TaxID=2116701 RepID=A0A2P7SQR5_9HYPH|nr:NUDIX domain-containing protein [Mesorhizobium ephedrae]PSJ64840.1 DNA mismatch repair protein MutT [Mesorhizobium ephedrae]
MEEPIVIAAAILLDRDGRMLTVRKRGTVEFMQPGGKIDPGETPVQALARELIEEIGVTLPDLSQVSDHGVFRAPAAHQPGRTVEAHVFAFGHDRPVGVSGEIEELAWVDPHAPADLPLAALTRDFMLPLARSLRRER